MNHYILNTALLVLLALLQSACQAADDETLAPQLSQLGNSAPKRILFVGNSYLYYNDSVHNHVRRIAAENGPHAEGDYQYKSATIGGARLSHHNLDNLLEPGRLGIDEPFDLVVLQGGSGEVRSAENQQAFAENATAMASQIRGTRAEVALYMTHAYVEPHRLYDPKMIDKIVETYVGTGNSINAFVIPVGLAFQRAYEQRPEIVLHKTFDGSHPSLLGTYLAACVVYASIYQRPAVDIHYTYFGAVSEDDARFLRRIADETVGDFYR